MNMIEDLNPKPITVNGLLSEFKKKEESALNTYQPSRERSRATPIANKTASSWQTNIQSPLRVNNHA